MKPMVAAEILWQLFASTGAVWAYLIYRHAGETSHVRRDPATRAS